MTPKEACPQEAAVLAANRSGHWQDSLAVHFGTCPRCREAVRIGGWMQTLAAASPRHRPLPDPELLWIKSRLFGQHAATVRAFEPLLWGDTLARALVGAFAAAWLALNWPRMQDYLVGLWIEGFGAESLLQASGNPWPLTFASLVVASALAALVLALLPRLTRN